LISVSVSDGADSPFQV